MTREGDAESEGRDLVDETVICAVTLLPIVAGLLAGIRIAGRCPRYRTLIRCGAATAGFAGYFAISAIFAEVTNHTLGIGPRLVLLAPVLMLVHIPAWRHAWIARRNRATADDAPPADGMEIASLLHDTVGQGLTLIAMQARSSAARSRDVQELTIIDQVATRTMAELRHVLGHLHETRPLADRMFEEGLIDVVNRFRASGVTVEFVAYGSEKHVPGPIRAVLVRVAREALSNAIKHDGDAEVTIELHVSPSPRLVVRTRSAAETRCGQPRSRTVARTEETSSSGHGTRMMQRLVTGHGGALRVAGGQGDFRVEAVFPAAKPELQDA